MRFLFGTEHNNVVHPPSGYLPMSSTISCNPPGNENIEDDFINNHRSLVASATYDSQEQPPENPADLTIEEYNASLSVASTVNIDNTHAYLVRNAEMHALKSDTSEMNNVGATRFIKVHERKNRKSVSTDNGTGPKIKATPQFSRELSLFIKPPPNVNKQNKVASTATKELALPLTAEEENKAPVTTTEEFSAPPTPKQDMLAPLIVAKEKDPEILPLSSSTWVQTDETFLASPAPEREPSGEDNNEAVTEGTQTDETFLALSVASPEPSSTIEAVEVAVTKLSSEAVTEPEAPKSSALPHTTEVDERVVNFETNPTPLFQYLYAGKWSEAQAKLESHPEEASIWVIRYSKNTDNGGEKESPGNMIRWKLLPLHLFIALCGSSTNDQHLQSIAETPDDEHDERINDSSTASSPPLQLFMALLSIYPQATQCPDDQGMIPLHSAIRGDSSLFVIEKLLEVDPSSIYWKDGKGRDASSLAKRLLGKNKLKQEVGEEFVKQKATERKHVRLMKLLSDTAIRTSPPLEPKKHPDQQRTTDQGKVVEEKKMHRLETKILILSRDNALLRHRALRTEFIMKQMQQRMHSLEKQLSSEIDNYDKLFGSMDDMDNHRERISHSVPKGSEDENNDESSGGNEKGATQKDTEKDNDIIDDKANRTELDAVIVDGIDKRREKKLQDANSADSTESIKETKQAEEKLNSGNKGGYYTKRLERHRSSSRKDSLTDDAIISTISTMTTATESTTPPSPPSISPTSPTISKTTAATQQSEILQDMDWESRCRALELESFDEDDDNALYEDVPDKDEDALLHGIFGEIETGADENGRKNESEGNAYIRTGKDSDETKVLNSTKNAEGLSLYSNDIFRKQYPIAVMPNSDSEEDDDALLHEIFGGVAVSKINEKYAKQSNAIKQIDEHGNAKTVPITDGRFEDIEIEIEGHNESDTDTAREGANEKEGSALYCGIFGASAGDSDADNSSDVSERRQLTKVENDAITTLDVNPEGAPKEFPITATQNSHASYADAVKYSGTTATHNELSSVANETKKSKINFDEKNSRIVEKSKDDECALSTKSETTEVAIVEPPFTLSAERNDDKPTEAVLPIEDTAGSPADTLSERNINETPQVKFVSSLTPPSMEGFDTEVASEIQRLREKFHLMQ